LEKVFKKIQTTIILNDFTIDCLDHVAIRVADLKASASWYTKVLGLTAHKLPKWGESPVFMLAGKTGIALFPANSETNKRKSIDHFAFRVSSIAFKKALQKFEELEIPYTVQDHTYFLSVYITDLDNHTVELTTLHVLEDPFCKK